MFEIMKIDTHHVKTYMRNEGKNISLQQFFLVRFIGPTNVGKSTVFEVLEHADGIFTKPIKAVYYCYSVDQPLFAEIKKKPYQRLLFSKVFPPKLN